MWFDYINIDVAGFRTKLQGLNIDIDGMSDFVWYNHPRKKLENGLVLIVSNESVNDMFQLLFEHGYINVYMEHEVEVLKQLGKSGPHNGSGASSVNVVVGASEVVGGYVVNLHRSEPFLNDEEVLGCLTQDRLISGEQAITTVREQTNTIAASLSRTVQEARLSDDNLSFVTTSDDSEVDEARRRRSQHKIFDDTFLIPEFEIGMHEELHLEITISQARRAKQLIIKEFQGDCKKEYSKLFDYRREILTRNQTSTVEIYAERPTPDSNPVFIRFYAKGCYVFVGEFGPKIWEKIEEHRAAMSRCYMLSRALVEYEIKERNDSFVVNVHGHTCTCRVWQLNGIPCKHAMLAIQNREENFEDYVHPYYRRQAYINTYKHYIIPLDEMERWEETGMPPLDPPVERKTTGKPKKKKHLEDWEISNGSNISRKGKIMSYQAKESLSTQANVVNNIPIVVEMPIGDAKVVGGVEMQLQLENQQVAGGVQLQMQPKKELLVTDDQTGNVNSNLMGIQQAKKGRKKDANNYIQCPPDLPQEFIRKCQHKRKAKPIIKEPVVESGSGTINIEVNEGTSHGQQVHVHGKGKAAHGNKGKVVQTTKKAQRFARLRAMEQHRLDEMELANWSALIQAMGSIDDGNNCP
ncbi:hypothetical protein SLEP1_g19029 [Rubroshorea leprosula]|nr:hypothetical protein SLEP1_g19029 [Rubroshorea leprosula]